MSKRKAATSLAIRPATKKARVRPSAVAGQADGLYARVFAGDSNLDDVAAEWATGFQSEEAEALVQVVNFVLRASGCESKIDAHDVADPDNCPNKLGEIQDEYEAVCILDGAALSCNY